MALRRTRLRLLIVASLAALWMVAAAGRLAYLQLFCYSDYLARALRQQRHIVQISPKRAPIYDRNLLPLAMSIEVDSCFAVPSEIADPEMAARLLAGALGIPQSVVEERIASSSSFAWVERKLSPEKARRVAALNLKGVYFQKENQRFYPKRELAAHVLGYVDIDEKGLAGVEYELNDQIRTKPGRVFVLGDARARLLESRGNTQDTSARVVLKLDKKIQYIPYKPLHPPTPQLPPTT